MQRVTVVPRTDVVGEEDAVWSARLHLDTLLRAAEPYGTLTLPRVACLAAWVPAGRVLYVGCAATRG